jgi:hypothetical protein
MVVRECCWALLGLVVRDVLLLLLLLLLSASCSRSAYMQADSFSLSSMKKVLLRGRDQSVVGVDCSSSLLVALPPRPCYISGPGGSGGASSVPPPHALTHIWGRWGMMRAHSSSSSSSSSSDTASADTELAGSVELSVDCELIFVRGLPSLMPPSLPPPSLMVAASLQASCLAAHPSRPLYVSGSSTGGICLWSFGEVLCKAAYVPSTTSQVRGGRGTAAAAAAAAPERDPSLVEGRIVLILTVPLLAGGSRGTASSAHISHHNPQEKRCTRCQSSHACHHCRLMTL